MPEALEQISSPRSSEESDPAKAPRQTPDDDKMTSPVKYNYPSPLEGVESTPPLSEERNADGKSLVNPPKDGLSAAYERFTDPLDNGRRGGL